MRTEDAAPRTRAADDLGLSREEFERLVFASEWSDRATLGQISPADLWENVCAHLNLSPGQSSELQQAFWGGDRLDHDLVQYIRGLRPRLRTALLSNAFADLRSALERWGIADAFDQVIISAEVGLMKPDLRIFELALRRLEVSPSEAVFIDDFELNVRAAQAAGLAAIRFRTPAQVRAELEAML